MINTNDILETINMIRDENLDIRAITMGISLYDCASESVDRTCELIYDKITRSAKNLVQVGYDLMGTLDALPVLLRIFCVALFAFGISCALVWIMFRFRPTRRFVR